jgi:hypothetical protein
MSASELLEAEEEQKSLCSRLISIGIT